MGASLVCLSTVSLIFIRKFGLVNEHLMHPYLVKVGLSSFTSAIVSAISASLSFSGL